MKKVVLITGSTRGIGKAIAFELIRDGYQVILHGTKESAIAKETLQEIKKISKGATIFYFDVGESQQVAKVCAEILHRYGRVDILVNNAGIVRNKLFSKMDLPDWDAVLKTNLYGPFLVTKQFLPAMIENTWGRIVNMSSISGEIGDFGQTNYSTTKAGIVGFTKSLAKEVARYNITVNAVSPGLVKTDILKDVPKPYMEKLLEKIPLKRVAETKEIAKLVRFLVSDEAVYITGANMHINGGWL